METSIPSFASTFQAPKLTHKSIFDHYEQNKAQGKEKLTHVTIKGVLIQVPERVRRGIPPVRYFAHTNNEDHFSLNSTCESHSEDENFGA